MDYITSMSAGALNWKRKMHADHIIGTTDGDHTRVEVIVGLICTYRRDMQCSNNSVMDTIIICPVLLPNWRRQVDQRLS